MIKIFESVKQIGIYLKRKYEERELLDVSKIYSIKGSYAEYNVKRYSEYLTSDEVDRTAKENIYKLFGAGIKQEDAKDVEIIGSTICDPLLINNLKKCDENGLLSFKEYGKFKYEKIMDKIEKNLTEEECEYCRKILLGGDGISIIDMKAQELDKCIVELNDYFGDDKTIQDVLNPHVNHEEK